MTNVLKNKTVNNFVVGVVLGLATLNFVSAVIGPVVNNWFGEGAATAWSWNAFWAALVTYVVVWVVATLISQQAD